MLMADAGLTWLTSHNLCVLNARFGQLVFYIELPNAVYLVAEEVEAVGDVVSVTVYIDDRSPYGVLPGLEHKIHPLKTQV